MSGRDGDTGHVFICYAREDSRHADELQNLLESAGIRIWRDTADLWPGQDWRAEIRRAISESALVFLACFSRQTAGLRMSYQNEELALAVAQMQRMRPEDSWLIPVRFDECEVPDRDLGGGRTLTSIQRADLFGDYADRASARLVATIQRILGDDSSQDQTARVPVAGRSAPWPTPADPQRVIGAATGPGRSQAAASSLKSPARPSMIKIGFWGSVASGKTTYLAALSLAVAHASPPWTLTGGDAVSTEWLSSLTARMIEDRRFPEATMGIRELNFVMSGGWHSSFPPKAVRRRTREPRRFDLAVIDAPGETFTSTGHAPYRDDLIAYLAESQGIVFFFDPTLEDYNRDTLGDFHATAARLEQHIGLADGSRLPHYLAVCITKFDSPRIFAAARKAGYLVVGAEDAYGFPRVADAHAAAFFDVLCENFRPRGGRLLRHTIERYFHEKRIRYFVTSSIGFYVNESMRFSPDDCYNITDAHDIRGGIHPINVLEPFLWLADPDRYGSIISRRQRGCFPWVDTHARSRPACSESPAI